jgi:mannose-6-phosphate isomerase
MTTANQWYSPQYQTAYPAHRYLVPSAPAKKPILYPFLVKRELKHRLWGGQRLASWLDVPPPYPECLGESWEVYDGNQIRNGPLAGKTLRSVAEHYPRQFVGNRPLERYGSGIPLLTKFIDANDHLSIQVHPDDSYAHTYEATTGFHGKTEAWYILDAQPGAEIIYGLNRTIDRHTFLEAVQQGQLEPLVRRVPVQAGDVVLVPAGTLHAINAGITLFEIQERSDLTYRVYDYGRVDTMTGQPRLLHLDKALDVVKLSPSSDFKRMPLPMEPGNTRTLLVACPHFALERWDLTRKRHAITLTDSLELITVIEGAGELCWPGGSFNLRHGDSLVLPAMLGAWSLKPHTSALRVLRGYVPDLERDIARPLRAMKTNESAIACMI